MSGRVIGTKVRGVSRIAEVVGVEEVQAEAVTVLCVTGALASVL